MASFFIKSGLLAVSASFLESKFASPKALESVGLEGTIGLTPLIVVGTGLWAVVHGIGVNEARQKYMELAKKDGEKDVEERYGLPNLYAQGTSNHVKAFNCVQRGHQHIFETMAQTIVVAMIAWQTYPLSSAACMTLYLSGRISLSNGYVACGGDPSKRYTSPVGFFIWYGVLSVHILGALSAVKMMLGNAMY